MSYLPYSFEGLHLMIYEQLPDKTRNGPIPLGTCAHPYWRALTAMILPWLACFVFFARLSLLDNRFVRLVFRCVLGFGFRGGFWPPRGFWIALGPWYYNLDSCWWAGVWPRLVVVASAARAFVCFVCYCKLDGNDLGCSQNRSRSKATKNGHAGFLISPNISICIYK